ncbi:hypothetical protein [Carp edema virus]|nr:hypothetical protein [Carp edema virus]
MYLSQSDVLFSELYETKNPSNRYVNKIETPEYDSDYEVDMKEDDTKYFRSLSEGDISFGSLFFMNKPKDYFGSGMSLDDNVVSTTTLTCMLTEELVMDEIKPVQKEPLKDELCYFNYRNRDYYQKVYCDTSSIIANDFNDATLVEEEPIAKPGICQKMINFFYCK